MDSWPQRHGALCVALPGLTSNGGSRISSPPEHRVSHIVPESHGPVGSWIRQPVNLGHSLCLCKNCFKFWTLYLTLPTTWGSTPGRLACERVFTRSSCKIWVRTKFKGHAEDVWDPEKGAGQWQGPGTGLARGPAGSWLRQPRLGLPQSPGNTVNR